MGRTADRFVSIGMGLMLAFVLGWAACGDDTPSTLIARKGSVIVGVWDAPDVKQAKSVLRTWLETPVPPDNPPMSQIGIEDLLELLPPTDTVPGWERIGNVERHPPAELEAFLRASATQYEAFGVREVVSVEFRNLRISKEPLLRVDLYDMGTPENAFGFYSQRRIPGGTFRAFGGETFVGVRELYGWVDRFYFFVPIYEFAGDTKEAMLGIAEYFDRRLEGGVVEPPTLVQALRRKGIVPFSMKWFRTPAQLRTASERQELLLLGLDASTRGFTAKLRVDEEDQEPPEAFYVAFPAEERAKAAYEALVGALGETVGTRPLRLGEEGVRFAAEP